MKTMLNYVMSIISITLTTAGIASAAIPGTPPPSIPEPGTMMLLGVGAAGLIIYKKIKK